MKPRPVFVCSLAVLSVLAIACGDKSPTPADKPTTPAKVDPKSDTPVVAVSAASQKRADELFSTVCAACHGATGKGDGMAAAALNPKPRDYSDKQWQSKVTDDAIAKAIVEGGPAVGLSPMMPPNPDLKDKPEVVKALVAKIRSFAK